LAVRFRSLDRAATDDEEHSTINGNEKTTRLLVDHGLVCKLLSFQSRGIR
jgi:hypothetical protein